MIWLLGRCPCPKKFHHRTFGEKVVKGKWSAWRVWTRSRLNSIVTSQSMSMSDSFCSSCERLCHALIFSLVVTGVWEPPGDDGRYHREVTAGQVENFCSISVHFLFFLFPWFLCFSILKGCIKWKTFTQDFYCQPHIHKLEIWYGERGDRIRSKVELRVVKNLT